MATKTKPRVTVRPPRAGEPEVLLDVEFADERLTLVLANVGPATAFDVHVEFVRPVRGVGGEVVVSELALFKHLPLLRSGKEVRVFLDTRPALFARKRESRRIRARVVYRSRTERWLGETFTHDLRIWEHWGEVR